MTKFIKVSIIAIFCLYGLIAKAGNGDFQKPPLSPGGGPADAIVNGVIESLDGAGIYGTPANAINPGYGSGINGIVSHYNATYGPLLSKLGYSPRELFWSDGPALPGQFNAKGTNLTKIGLLIKLGTLLVLISVCLSVIIGARKNTYTISDLGMALVKTVFAIMLNLFPGVLYMCLIVLGVCTTAIFIQHPQVGANAHEIAADAAVADGLKSVAAEVYGIAAKIVNTDKGACDALDNLITSFACDIRRSNPSGGKVTYRGIQYDSVGQYVITSPTDIETGTIPEGDHVFVLASTYGIALKKLIDEGAISGKSQEEIEEKTKARFLSLRIGEMQVAKERLVTAMDKWLGNWRLGWTDSGQFKDLRNRIEEARFDAIARYTRKASNPDALAEISNDLFERVRALARPYFCTKDSTSLVYKAFNGYGSFYAPYWDGVSGTSAIATTIIPKQTFVAPLEGTYRALPGTGKDSAASFIERYDKKSGWLAKLTNWVQCFLLSLIMPIIGRAWVAAFEIEIIALLILSPFWIHPKTEKNVSGIFKVMLGTVAFMPFYIISNLFLAALITFATPSGTMAFFAGPAAIAWPLIAIILIPFASIVLSVYMVKTVLKGGNFLGGLVKAGMMVAGSAATAAFPATRAIAMGAGSLMSKAAADGGVVDNSFVRYRGKLAQGVRKWAKMGLGAAGGVANQSQEAMGRVFGANDKYFKKGQSASQVLEGAGRATFAGAKASASAVIKGAVTGTFTRPTEMFKSVAEEGDRREQRMKQAAEGGNDNMNAQVSRQEMASKESQESIHKAQQEQTEIMKRVDSKLGQMLEGQQKTDQTQEVQQKILDRSRPAHSSNADGTAASVSIKIDSPETEMIRNITAGQQSPFAHDPNSIPDAKTMDAKKASKPTTVESVPASPKFTRRTENVFAP